LGSVKRNSGEIEDFIRGYGNGDGRDFDVIYTACLPCLRQFARKDHNGRHERESENSNPASRQIDHGRHAHPSRLG